MTGLLTVADVGNSAIDFAEFTASDCQNGSHLPRPNRKLKLGVDALDFDHLREWCHNPLATRWLLGSVNQSALHRLQEWLARYEARARVLENRDLHIVTAVRNPNSVGIDRLASATAANRLRTSTRPAIVVDMGSATTIDVVSNEGRFMGGMIAPGPRLCAQSLAKNTSQLPLIDLLSPIDEMMSPPHAWRKWPSTPNFIGDNTETAMRAGIHWLCVAGVDGILHRLQNELAGPCDVFVTGGYAPMLIPHLSARTAVRHEPDLVVSGLATAR